MVPCGTVLAAQLPRPLQAADQRVVVTGVSLSLPAGAFRHFYVQATFMRFGRGFRPSTAEAMVSHRPSCDPLLWLVFFPPLLHLPEFR